MSSSPNPDSCQIGTNGEHKTAVSAQKVDGNCPIPSTPTPFKPTASLGVANVSMGMKDSPLPPLPPQPVGKPIPVPSCFNLGEYVYRPAADADADPGTGRALTSALGPWPRPRPRPCPRHPTNDTVVAISN